MCQKVVIKSQKFGYVQKRINLNLKKNMCKRITGADFRGLTLSELSPLLRDSQKQNAKYLKR